MENMDTRKSLRILHLLFTVNETSAPYNEHCLPRADDFKVSVCSYFKSSISSSPKINTFEGNNSLKGFFKVLNAAFNKREYDLIHIHSIQLLVLFLLANLFKFKKYIGSIVYTIHSPYQIFKLRYKLMFIPVFLLIRKIVSCSEASYLSFPLLFKWLAGSRLCFVQNGVDIARIDSVIGEKWQNIREGPFTIASVGRLIQSKNPLMLVNGFHRSNDFLSRLIIIGEGNLRDQIIATVKSFDLANQVELTGIIAREKLYSKLIEVDLFVSTSRIEGLPISVLEAMVCGCPVLLSDIPSHREIADDADFIPLVNPNNVEGFANEIKRFRKMPANERADIGRKCRLLVEEKFKLSTMHKAYEKIYLEILRYNRCA